MMEDTCAYMTETVFIKNYRGADKFPIKPGDYEQMCAAGNAEMDCFLRQMLELFAIDPEICALLVNSNRLAQTQHGTLRVYLDPAQRNVTVHITSVLYLLFGEALQLFQSITALADCVIVRPKKGEQNETYFSVRKDLP